MCVTLRLCLELGNEADVLISGLGTGLASLTISESSE